MTSKVHIQGAKSDSEMAKETQIKSEVTESAKEMDTPKPLPVEVTIPSRDLKEETSDAEKIQQTKTVLEEESLSAITEAEPKKAKARQVRKRKNTEPMPPAGTPSPDYLKQMQERFDKIEELQRKTYELYSSYPKVLASQTPLQQNGVVAGQKRMRTEYPKYSGTYVEQDPDEEVEQIPLHNRNRGYAPERISREVVDQHEVDLYRRRNKEALESMRYDTESTLNNRRQSSQVESKTAHWYSAW